MSLDIISEQIQQFISSPEPEVMAIYGGWGTGKTYAWKELSKKYKKDFVLKKYAYVSLFGINSIESLKTAIFQDMIDPNSIEAGPSIQSFSKNIKSSVSSIVKNISVGNKNVQLSVGQILSDVSFLYVKDAIICIDDLERKGNNFLLHDILGLVNQLKEEKRCKIVLIFNNDQFTADDQSIFKKYIEKVVDSRLYFSLTAKEAAEIALTDFALTNFGLTEIALTQFVLVDGCLTQRTSDITIHNQLKKLITRLDLKNIRIIKKIEKSIKSIECIVLEITEYSTVYNILHSIVLFTTCYYTSGTEYPTISYLKNFQKLNYFDKKKSDSNPHWDNILRHYSFCLMDELDLVIVDLIKYGYVNKAQLSEETKKIAEKSKIKNLVKACWKPFYESFNNNEKKIADSLKKLFYENYKALSPRETAEIVYLLTELKDHKKYKEYEEYEAMSKAMIDHIKKHCNDEFIDEFDSHYLGTASFLPCEPNKTFNEVLEKIASNDKYTSAELKLVAEASITTYYDFFKQEYQPFLFPLVKACLDLRNVKNVTPELLEIANKTEETLMLIGKESQINKIRVTQCGVSVPGVQRLPTFKYLDLTQII